MDTRPGFPLRLPEGATQESADGMHVSFAATADSIEFVGYNPVGEGGIRRCTLTARENHEPFTVRMFHDIKFMEEATADLTVKTSRGRHPALALWIRAVSREPRPGYIIGNADGGEGDE